MEISQNVAAGLTLHFDRSMTTDDLTTDNADGTEGRRRSYPWNPCNPWFISGCVAVVLLSLTNATALAQFARGILRGDLTNSSHQKTEAAFHLRRALQFAPDKPEVLQILNEIGAEVGVGKQRKQDE